MSDILRGWLTLSSEAQAAWVQAVFSVVGIGVAIAIPAGQHFRERRERALLEKREARALAILLLPTLSIWIDRISDHQKVLRHHLKANFPGPVDWRSISDALTLGEQGKLLAPKTHLMGLLSDDAQGFFYNLASAQQAATDRVGRTREIEDDINTLRELDGILDKAILAAVAAREKVHILLGGDAR